MENKTPYEQVYQYCLDRYEVGYDLIIETWTESELRFLVDKLGAPAARKWIDKYVSDLNIHYAEQRAAFDL